MSSIKDLNQWHQTRRGWLVFALAELVIAYVFASLAIDRGNIWWYLLTIVFSIGSVQNFLKLFGSIISGNRSKAKKT